MQAERLLASEDFQDFSPELVLGSLGPSVHQSRERFLIELDTLPGPFAEVAGTHYRERLMRAGGRPVLGEYVPWLLADIYATPPEALHRNVVPWLLLYEHGLMLDDIIDRPSAVHPSAVIVANLLLTRSLSSYALNCGRDDLFWPAFNKYYESAALAGVHEAEVFRDPARMFDRAEHLAMGRKSAMVKMCASVFSIGSEQRLLLAPEEDALDALCAGYQLCDDLADWREDLRERNHTYPLQKALSWLSSVRGTESADMDPPTEPEALASILLSGAAIDTAVEANAFLEAAIADTQFQRPGPMLDFLRALTRRNARCAEELQRMLSQGLPELDEAVESLQMPRTFQFPRHAAWHDMLKRFRILAQGSS